MRKLPIRIADLDLKCRLDFGIIRVLKNRRAEVLDERKIPRIVHQTFANLDDLSPEIIEKNRRMAILNPQYTFEFYDDVTMGEWMRKHCNPKQFEIFQSINPKYGAAKADYFRYLLMYKIGGVYLDIKSTCIMPLDEIILFSDEFIVSKWEVDPVTGKRKYGRHKELQELEIDEYQQWFLISMPQNPVILSVIDYISEQILLSPRHYRTKFGKLGVLELTGPIAFSKVVGQFVDQGSMREINSFSEGFRYKSLIGSSEISYSTTLRRHYSKIYEPIVLENCVLKMRLQTYLNILLFRWLEGINIVSYRIIQKIKNIRR